MRPIKTKTTTRVLRAPMDLVEKFPCEDLPVAEGDGIMASYWRTTWRERFAILFGRPVRLVLNADRHPPVYLDTKVT